MTVKKKKHSNVSFRLPDELLEQIDALIPTIFEERDGERTTRAVVIRNLIRAGLKMRRDGGGQ